MNNPETMIKNVRRFMTELRGLCYHSWFGPGASPISISSRLRVNKLARFEEKSFMKTGARASCGSTLLFHPHSDTVSRFIQSRALAPYDLY